MMSSCCTLRLKRRSAFSRDSLSWIMTSATFTLTPNPVRIGYVRCDCFLRHRPWSLSHASCRAVTHTAAGVQLSSHRAAYKYMPHEPHFDLRTINRCGLTLMIDGIF